MGINIGHNRLGIITIHKATAIGKIIATDSSCSTNCSYSNVGGIIGADNGQVTKILNSWTDTDIIGNGAAHGGIAGYLGSQTSKIQYSHAYGDVTTLTSVTTINFGGIVGSNNGKILDSFYSLGTVKAQSQVGGIVGFNTSNATNATIYAEVNNVFIDNATVEGSLKVGGIAGYNQGKILNAYSSASVNLTDAYATPRYIGGLVGKSVKNSGGVVPEVDNSVSYGTVTQVSGSTYSDVAGSVGYAFGTLGTDYILNNVHFTDPMTGTFNFGGQTTSFTCGSNIICSTAFNVSGSDAVHKLKDEVDYFEDAGNFLLPTPIMIDSVAKWNAIGDNPILMSKHFKLNANINFSTATNNETTPIGSMTHPFIGFFEGDYNYSVNNPSITDTGGNGVALFPVLGDEFTKIPGHIGEPHKPLKINDSEIYSKNTIATVVANLVEGKVSAVVTNGHIEIDNTSSAADTAGGIVGYLGSMSTQSRMANVIGSSYHGEIVVAGTYGATNVGGLVGWQKTGDIEGSRAEVDLQGSDKVGGIVGRMVDGSIHNVLVKNKALGSAVKALTGDAGGLIGYIGATTTSNIEITKVNIGGLNVENVTSGDLGFLIGEIGTDSGGTITISDIRVNNSTIVQNDTSGSYTSGLIGRQNSSNYTSGEVNIANTYLSNTEANVSSGATFDPVTEANSGYSYGNVRYDSSVGLTTGASGSLGDNSGYLGVFYHTTYSDLTNNFKINYSSIDGRPIEDKWFVNSNGTLLLTP